MADEIEVVATHVDGSGVVPAARKVIEGGLSRALGLAREALAEPSTAAGFDAVAKERELASDRLADVLWWIAGCWAAGAETSASIGAEHLDAIRTARVALSRIGEIEDEYRAEIARMKKEPNAPAALRALQRCVGDLIVFQKNLASGVDRADLDRIIENARELRP
jgi:hypothetical protein